MILRRNSYHGGNADPCASLVLLTVLLPSTRFLQEIHRSQSLTSAGLADTVPPAERGGMHSLCLVGVGCCTRRLAGTWKEAGLL